MKVFVTRIISDSALQMMKDAGIEIIQWTEKRDLTAEELIHYCKHVDALLSAGGNRIDKSFLNACSHLKVISLHSVGYDKVDVPAATALKIPVGNTPGVLSDATADIAFLLILAVSRKAFYMYNTIIGGKWGFFEPTANLGIEIRNKTLGIFGLGKIGFELASRCASAFHMKIIYHNRNRNEMAEKELNAAWVSFEDLLKQSDVLSVHTSLTEQTTGKFNKAVFVKMKRTSIFINTARGAIHNEPDLIDALQNGIIWGAGLDVTDPEPMESNNPLLQMPNVSVLPHIGSATEETRNAMAVIAAENVIAGLKGKRLPFAVNPEVSEG